MRIECKSCGAKGNFDETRLPPGGANVSCPRCKEKIFVSPESAETPAAPAAPTPPSAPQAPQPMQPPPAAAAPQGQCVMCKNVFSTGDMVQMEGRWVCGSCKPNYVQMLKMGMAKPGTHRFAGFWIRFGAKIIDGIIMWVAMMLILVPLNLMLAGDPSQYSGDSSGTIIFLALFQFLIQIGLPVSYVTFFIGKYQATPGKMACGIKVVRPDGDSLTYMRAMGRGFAEMLSAMILYIGYLMAAFDEEKRSLHDRICDSRVVYK